MLFKSYLLPCSRGSPDGSERNTTFLLLYGFLSEYPILYLKGFFTKSFITVKSRIIPVVIGFPPPPLSLTLALTHMRYFVRSRTQHPMSLKKPLLPNGKTSFDKMT